jgi:hypothetical protein
MKLIYVYTDEHGRERGFVNENDASLARGYGSGLDRPPVREIKVFENYGEFADERNQAIIDNALAKLTAQEKKLLGLTFPEKPDEE